MKYTVLDTLPGIVKVKFEDGSWAEVPIEETYSLEDIDDAVSYYDPEFRTRPVNQNITTGSERTSKRKDDSKDPSNTVVRTETILNGSEEPVKTELYGGLPLPKIHKDQLIISYALADYFYKTNNDNRLQVELDKKLEEYITENNITVEDAINSLLYENDDLIMQLAEEELNNG